MATDVTTPKSQITAAEYAVMPEPADGSPTELVRGEVVTMSPPWFLHGYVQGNVFYVISTHVRRHKIGRVTVESGVITELGPDTVRGPDVAYWGFARLPADQTPVVFANVAPDLVAEVVSPSNTRKHIAVKIREYFALGAGLLWIVDPEERTCTVYRKPGDGQVLWEDANLDAGDILPGFSCRVGEFFE
jgi:Uma2 family endonuclease